MAAKKKQPPSSKEYVYLFIQPGDVNILEGFSTELKVMGVPKDKPNEPENVSQLVKLKQVPNRRDEAHARAVVKISRTDDNKAFQVKGIKPNMEPAILVARPLKARMSSANLEARTNVWVDESDLLVYAPDGLIYWLPTKTWMKARSFDPQHPDKQPNKPANKPAPGLKELSKALLPLLKNEAVVANIPHAVSTGKPPTAGTELPGAGAEPVTCFLLNLNSILMSYSPAITLPPGQQGPSSSRPGVPRAPSGRKR